MLLTYLLGFHLHFHSLILVLILTHARLFSSLGDELSVQTVMTCTGTGMGASFGVLIKGGEALKNASGKVGKLNIPLTIIHPTYPEKTTISRVHGGRSLRGLCV